MDDLPLWFKLIIWLTLGAVVVYVVANILRSAF
jgi:hypothetical protein